MRNRPVSGCSKPRLLQPPAFDFAVRFAFELTKHHPFDPHRLAVTASTAAPSIQALGTVFMTIVRTFDGPVASRRRHGPLASGFRLSSR